MQRLLISLAALPILAASVSAQCFEQSFGSLAPLAGTPSGLGDDTNFDVVPMNINFPMGGLSTSYSHATICTNGVIYLTTGAQSTGDTYAYNDLAYFLGGAGEDPRIAPFWIDLESAATFGSGVYFNNTIPGKFVVTWSNVVEWAAQGPAFTFQAQLFDNGDVQFFYDAGIYGISSGFGAQFVSRAGISEGNGVVDPGASDLSVGGAVNLASFAMYEEWPLNVFDLNSQTVQFVNAGTGYVEAIGPCTPAYNQVYGTGCYDISSAFYQYFDDAALAAAALTGNSMRFTPVGANYLVDWGGASYIIPTGSSPLTIGDDAEVSVTLSTGFPTAQGPVGTLYVGSNGVISVAPNAPGSTSYVINVNDLLNAPAMAWWVHHDFNPTEAGSGPITYVETTVGADTVALFTWEAVESYSNPLGPNPSTLQFQFNLSTGEVAIVFESIDADPTSIYGSAYRVGWAPGGGSNDGGAIDIPAVAPFVTTSANINRMELAVGPAPISTPTSGSTLTYTTSNIPEFAPGLRIGLNIISLSQVNPGLDLGFLGAPGCNAYIGSLDFSQAMVGPSSTMSVNFPLPLGVPAGTTIYSQSISLIQPNSLPNGQNSFGMTVSNGVLSYVSAF